MSSVETAGGRGERRGRRPARAAGDIAQLPWKQPRNLLPPVELVSADELESIHEAALTILEEIGMDVLLPEAREIYRAAGAHGRRPAGARRSRAGARCGRQGTGAVHGCTRAIRRTRSRSAASR